MTLEKAIELLREDFNRPSARFKPELQEARRLGIEALKRLRDDRNANFLDALQLLPSE